jgi:hypothetical protein
MPQIDDQQLQRVNSRMNYIASTGERPAYYLYEPRPGYTPPPPAVQRHDVAFMDVRSQMDNLTLDGNGFAFVRQPLPQVDFFDPACVERDYYAGCEALVKAATGATRVLAFDHNVRDKSVAAETDSGVREPVRFAHNDYTEVSGPQRVRDLMGDAAESLLEHRYMFVNVWRPLRGPVLDVPLAICDAGSLTAADFIATDLVYADRTGEIYSVRYDPAHRWYFLGRMQSEEIMLIKCFDSASDGRARYTAHAAFRDPGAPKDALPRRSVEVRTIALFAPE